MVERNASVFKIKKSSHCSSQSNNFFFFKSHLPVSPSWFRKAKSLLTVYILLWECFLFSILARSCYWWKYVAAKTQETVILKHFHIHEITHSNETLPRKQEDTFSLKLVAHMQGNVGHEPKAGCLDDPFLHMGQNCTKELLL